MGEAKRLFFGLELPDSCKQSIIQWRAQTFPAEAGRPVAADALHLTLAFLGEVSDEKARALMQLAGRIQQPSFSLTLDDAGHWPRSGVVWLGPRQAPRGLLQLAQLLRSQAARSGCAQPAQSFHPHVTILRQATQSVVLPSHSFHGSLPVERFVLFQSQFTGGRTRYKAIAAWPLL
ncbi:RNA 2',3'-cyclic phosphodiesterase [Erwinia piriflorinigrans]|uniref:RNA 2',3'-cyclic phosphodiesterase n=1 Tax=Erwinia piriflorinigrans CFBP 5888 TaxID=1161919 RepID=V5ZAC3_9GAMM|nr:RNA 2',3'-cyclic phosphodiesterase [Erwinia piriflorinigrans]CCG88195.1 2'-5' RNA ligase [Erwinia piriflorinigrans CFBP 5888]